MVQNMGLDSVFPNNLEPCLMGNWSNYLQCSRNSSLTDSTGCYPKQRTYAALHHSSSIGVTVVIDTMMYNTCDIDVGESSQIIRFAVTPKASEEISQNSQENTCARVSFLIKLQARRASEAQRLRVSEALRACNFIKKETLAQVFSCEFCEISKNTIFTEYLWTTAPTSGT